jgi:hypothetical protein
MDQMSGYIGVTKGVLIAHDTRNSDHRILAVLGDGLKEDTKSYEDYYYQHDEWTLRLPRHSLTGHVFQGEEVWPADSFQKSVQEQRQGRPHAKGQ